MPELKKYKMFIDGEWVDSESKKTFETLNPENNEPWAVAQKQTQKMFTKQIKHHKKHLKDKGQKYFQDIELTF